MVGACDKRRLLHTSDARKASIEEEMRIDRHHNMLRNVTTALDMSRVYIAPSRLGFENIISLECIGPSVQLRIQQSSLYEHD